MATSFLLSIGFWTGGRLLHRPEPIFSNQPRHQQGRTHQPQRQNQRSSAGSLIQRTALKAFCQSEHCRGRRPEAPADSFHLAFPKAKTRRGRSAPVILQVLGQHQSGQAVQRSWHFCRPHPLANRTLSFNGSIRRPGGHAGPGLPLSGLFHCRFPFSQP